MFTVSGCLYFWRTVVHIKGDISIRERCDDKEDNGGVHWIKKSLRDQIKHYAFRWRIDLYLQTRVLYVVRARWIQSRQGGRWKKSGINYSKSPGYSEQWTRLMGGIYRSRGAPWAIAARNLVWLVPCNFFLQLADNTQADFFTWYSSHHPERSEMHMYVIHKKPECNAIFFLLK